MTTKLSTRACGRAARGVAVARRAALVGLLSTALAVAGIPRGAAAQDASAPGGGGPAAAMAQAEQDALADTSGTMWMAVGCLVGVLGVVIGYVVEPSPPPTRLLGRSPEYVASYTQAYRYAGKREQGSKALTGCLVGTGVAAVIYAVAIASMTSSTTAY